MVRASTRRLLSVLASFLLLVGAIYAYNSLLRAEYTLVNEQRGILASKRELLANQKKIIGKVREVLGKYEGTIKLQDTISLALPNEESIPSLFNQIYAIARATGLGLQSMNLSVQPVKGAKIKTAEKAAPETASSPQKISIVKIGTIQMTIQLLGSYSSLKSFLQTLESNIRVMDVQSLTFAATDKGVTSYSLVVNTYYQTK